MEYSIEIPVKEGQQSTISVDNVLNEIKKVVNNGSLGNFSVDSSYTVCQRNRTTGDCIVSTASSATPFPTSTSRMIDESIFSSEFVTSVELELESSVSTSMEISSLDIVSTPIVESSYSDISSESESSIAPSVTETEILSSSISPEISTVKVVSSLKINQEFTEELENSSSAEFQEFERDFCDGVIMFHIILV